jgi:hypothetical protein
MPDCGAEEKRKLLIEPIHFFYCVPTHPLAARAGVKQATWAGKYCLLTRGSEAMNSPAP